MTRVLDLSSLSRRELENLILTEHGALSRVLRAIRESTTEDWKVRRAVERIVEEAVDRRPFVVAYIRSGESKAAELAAQRNASYWEGIRA